MAFNVNYSFNNGAKTGTATSITALRQAIYSYGLDTLNQCTLSGTAEGDLTTGNSIGTSTGNSRGIFQDCSNLVSLDLSSFDTSNVTSMKGMLQSCSSLTSLDLSNLDTSNVNTMYYMFSDCSSLTSLGLSNFNTSNVTSVSRMFSGCSNLEHIYIGENWSVSQVSDSYYMFTDCIKLPNFNSSYIDKTKAYYGDGGYLEYKGPPIPTVPLIKLGSTSISAIKLGDTEISKIYLGEIQL